MFLLAAALLVLAGVAKIVRPTSTAQALYAAGLPGGTGAVRGLGVVEVVVGVAALLRPVPAVGFALAGLYAGFAAFVAYLKLARPQAASCGCAGAHEVPPSWVHVAFNLTAAISGIVAAVVGVASPRELVLELGWLAIPAAIGLGVAGWLVTVLVAETPTAFGSWTAPTHHEQQLFDPDRHRRADAALAMSGVGPGHESLWPDTDAPSLGDPGQDAG